MKSIRTYEYVDPATNQPKVMCAQWHEQLEEWRGWLFSLRMSEGVKHLEGCVFTEETTLELTQWVQKLGIMMETTLPKKCGECPCCWEEQGKCPHGWSEKSVCPDCSGRLL